MALRKEPSRRYASAEQLSEDLRRHLEKWADQNEGDKRHEIRNQIAALAGWWAKTERL